MTTLVPFTPSNNATPPFQANFVLDGTTYICSAIWNVAGQRWYVTLKDQFGTVIINQPLIGSPLNKDIYLFLGMFNNSTCLYRENTGNFEVNS